MADRQQAAYDAWWGELSRRGDPIRRPNLVREAFKAAWEAVLTPDPSLRSSVPIVMFFATKAEADEFVELVQEAKPNMRGRMVDG